MKSLRAACVSTLIVLSIGSAIPAVADESGEAKTFKVKYDDLDMNTDQGTKRLYARLRGAARNVCSPLEGKELQQRERWMACYQQALNRAVTEVNVEKVTALHQRVRNVRAS